jgi:hypothetical protein
MIERERARELASMFLAGCLDEPTAGLAGVSRSFRCWTPLDDWQEGPAGLEALNRVLVSAHTAGLLDLKPDAAITDGEVVVLELAAPSSVPATPTVTIVLTLDGDVVEEARCYVDVRLLDLSGHLKRSES